MFQLTTTNELYCKALCQDGQGALFTKAGAMVGFEGRVQFEKVLLGPQGNPLQALVGQLGRRVTGENLPLMKCKPQGPCCVYLADMAQHITVLPLAGTEIKVESENIIAFTESCRYGFKFLAQGVISQKGFFTSVLSGTSQYDFAAISTNGNPLVLNTPCNVDPDALVAWTGPDPMPKLDLSWKNIIGQASGESYNFAFSQPGYQVIIQPYERQSGLHLGIDDKRYTPEMQQQQSLGGAAQNVGNTMSQLGNMLGGGGGQAGGQGGLGGMIGGLFR